MIYEFILPYQEKELILLPDSIKVGIDHGAIDAINKGIKLDYALGDFDSISNEDLNLIKELNIKIIKLNPIKDDTDTEHAINYFKDADKIIIHGGIKGKRVEHLLANINLILKYKNIIFIDETTKIMLLEDMTLTKDEYKYISIFSYSDSYLDLKGFKYNLDNYNLKPLDNLAISNELVSDKGIIKFNGLGIIIFSKNDYTN